MHSASPNKRLVGFQLKAIFCSTLCGLSPTRAICLKQPLPRGPHAFTTRGGQGVTLVLILEYELSPSALNNSTA